MTLTPSEPDAVSLALLYDPVFDPGMTVLELLATECLEVRYVCTTELNQQITDIYFRTDRKKHPIFGNRYLGVFMKQDTRCMTNADEIEGIKIQDEHGNRVRVSDGQLVSAEHH